MSYDDNVKLLKKTFSSILKSHIAEYGYTVKGAAEKCCICDRQIQYLEKGTSLPEFITLINIIITFKIDFNQYIDLITEQGYTPIDKEK